MSRLGNVCIGSKSPDFYCDAVVGGKMTEVSLSTYINPTPSDTEGPSAPWLILLFIPAAFSVICPTEVLAFQNCHDEFRDRNCNVAFVSVDTKHSLWHWQNTPQKYGGLGNIDIPLLSDASHKIGRDYGVLIEDQGICLRGMFIIDGHGIVQQVTLNSLSVGRSVLEALRLLEAFQAVAKHGVLTLCAAPWGPSYEAKKTIETVPIRSESSVEKRLEDIQKEFGPVQVTDLDVKYKTESSMDSNPSVDDQGKLAELNGYCPDVLSSSSGQQTSPEQEVYKRPTDLRKRRSRLFSSSKRTPTPTQASLESEPQSTPTPASPQLLPTQPPDFGHHRTPSIPSITTHLTDSASSSPSRPSLSHRRTQSTSAVFRPPLARQATHVSQSGFPVVLEFADPVGASMSPLLSPAMSHDSKLGVSEDSAAEGVSPETPGLSRWQAAFQAVRNVALASPRAEMPSFRKTESGDAILLPGFFDTC